MDKIYLEIKRIAESQPKGEALTRADLAYELKKFSISHDSSDVSRLVYEAWEKFNHNKKIYEVFITNDKSHSVVESYEINFAAESRDSKALAKISKTHLDKGSRALKTLKTNIEETLSDYKDSGTETSIRAVITGSSGVNDIQATAQNAYEKYSVLIDAYDSARNEVKASMSDFVFLREQVNDILHRYTVALTDIFGDSIKAIDPQMFDFDSVEWLDIENMLKNVRLEYNTIASSCSTLISEITENFAASLKSSVQMYRSTGDRYTGLALAAMGMLSHYVDASERTVTLKKELVRFTDKIKKDAITIKGDFSRLNVIYRTISELYIPKANAFYKYADSVLTNELQTLLDSIYSNEATARLKEKRDGLFDEYKEIESRIIDARMAIDAYTANIKANEQLLELNRDNYRQAKQLRPSKPSFLINIITFGGAGKRFNRDLSEWYDNYSEAVKYYERLVVDVKMDQEELKALTLGMNKDMATLKKNKIEAKKLCDTMKRTLLVSDADKMKVLHHLESMVQLLRIAKEIVSSSLDEKHIKAVKISDYKSLELPEDVRKSIESIAAEVRSGLTDSELTGSYSAIEETESTDANTPENIQMARDMEALKNSEDKLIQKTVSLFEEYAKLKALQTASSLSDAEYMGKLKILQKEFNAEMDEISSRGDILRESLRRINTATNRESLKDALLTLSGDENLKLSEQDFERFLKGETNIEI